MRLFVIILTKIQVLRIFCWFLLSLRLLASNILFVALVRGIYFPRSRSALRINELDYIGFFVDFEQKLVGFIIDLKGWFFETIPVVFVNHILVLLLHFFLKNYLYSTALLVFYLDVPKGGNLTGSAHYFSSYSRCYSTRFHLLHFFYGNNIKVTQIKHFLVHFKHLTQYITTFFFRYS